MPLTKEEFAGNLNTRFWLGESEGERAALDLVEVRNGISSPRNEVFSLLFRGDPGRVHPQRTEVVPRRQMNDQKGKESDPQQQGDHVQETTEEVAQHGGIESLGD